MRIHQAHREQGRRGRAAGEDGRVDVGEGAQHLFDMVAMHAQVAHDLGVRVAVDDVDGPREVAQERHVRGDRRKVRHEAGHRQADAAALAAAGDGDPRRVDCRMGPTASTARTASA